MTSSWEKLREQDRGEKNKLVGAKVITVTDLETVDETGFILEFDNGIYLTALDGEYGENAFKFLSEEEVKEKLQLTKKWLEKKRR